jgi:hypothetical protein
MITNTNKIINDREQRNNAVNLDYSVLSENKAVQRYNSRSKLTRQKSK